MTRLRWLLLGAVLLGACATVQRTLVQDEPEGRLGEIFERFDHRLHMPIMEEVGWICLPCHTIGAHKTPEPVEGDEVQPTYTDPASSVLLPTQRICHTCHQPDNPLGAPSPCRTCHETENLPPPESHEAGWKQDHAREAVLQPEYCAGCHTGWMCAECHTRRDVIGTEVHTGNWLSVHGMAARTDPVSCEDCHQADTCRTCHTNPEGRQGW